jgi:hypothetical protein
MFETFYLGNTNRLVGRNYHSTVDLLSKWFRIGRCWCKFCRISKLSELIRSLTVRDTSPLTSWLVLTVLHHLKPYTTMQFLYISSCMFHKNRVLIKVLTLKFFFAQAYMNKSFQQFS